ncbi:MAG: hypothetical protein LBI96_06180 [Odoribacteraceae bacterium]|jgi:hypothetical protein|nr:hypothetical protein [Odoribacteraceae bacterium]
MATRKIGASYILLPGHLVARGAHLLWTPGRPPVIVPADGAPREQHAVEFHGGMIVSDALRDHIPAWQPGDHIPTRVAEAYAANPRPITALLLIRGADWETLTWTAIAAATPIP